MEKNDEEVFQGEKKILERETHSFNNVKT